MHHEASASLRICLLLFVVALADRGACLAAEGKDPPPRPPILAWAHDLEGRFHTLPGARGVAQTASASLGGMCRQTVAVIEAARAELLPTPTKSIDRAFTAYMDALLALYRECPGDPLRASALHDRANALGARLETLVNQTLDRAS